MVTVATAVGAKPKESGCSCSAAIETAEVDNHLHPRSGGRRQCVEAKTSLLELETRLFRHAKIGPELLKSVFGKGEGWPRRS